MATAETAGPEDNHCQLAPLIDGGNLVQTLNYATSANREEVDNPCPQSNDEVLLVCGSFYIMDDVRKYFCCDDTTESDDAAVNKV